MKRIFSLLLIFVVGGIGGIFLDRFVIPRLAQTSVGVWFPVLRRTSERTTIVNKTEIVRVEESEAIPDLAERVKKAAISIEIVRKAGKNGKLQKGTMAASPKEAITGLALTSDGFILAHDADGSLALGVSATSLAKVGILGIYALDEDGRHQASVVASDTSTNFVLLRVSDRQLTILPFEDDRPRLGARLFMLSANVFENTAAPSFQTAMLSAVTRDFFVISDAPLADAIIVDFEGRVAGMSVRDAFGKQSIVPASTLRRISNELLHKNP
ncbi:MAG: hypothetical protein Q7S09_00575 [bacterium]|nr:hypothetical protein [bacterium]